MSTDPARRAALLQEMGLGPLWTRRQDGLQAVPAPSAPVAAAAFVPEPALESLPPMVEDREADDLAWDLAPVAGAEALPTAAIAGMDWAQLEAAVASCTRCGLCQGRQRTVFGVGDRRAKWLFVGEGPGRNEDLQGEPFVGPAGRLLDNMLAALDLQRGENAFIANVVKCRPTGADGRDRPPSPEEIATCLPYLERQIALLRPQVLVALGKTAAVALLGLAPEVSLSSLRGKLHRHGDLPLVVTYHPAYLLRKPADKGKSWSDLCLALEAYGAG